MRRLWGVFWPLSLFLLCRNAVNQDLGAERKTRWIEWMSLGVGNTVGLMYLHNPSGGTGRCGLLKKDVSKWTILVKRYWGLAGYPWGFGGHRARFFTGRKMHSNSRKPCTKNSASCMLRLVQPQTRVVLVLGFPFKSPNNLWVRACVTAGNTIQRLHTTQNAYFEPTCPELHKIGTAYTAPAASLFIALMASSITLFSSIKIMHGSVFGNSN